MNSPSLSLILAEALAIADPQQREAYVVSACGSDSDCLRRVNELIEAHFNAGSFLESSFGKITAMSSLPFSAVRRSADFEPRRFGDYELLEEIARGGMGVVFRAQQLSLERVVAIKVILSGHFASRDEIQRFHTEAAAAAQLRHPNIVTVHAAGEHEGRPFFSMDYVAGTTLADLVRSGPLPAKRAAACVKKIALAIHYAHENGVVHRDLKPSNILIDQHGEPRITDFGLAKRAERNDAPTVAGQVFGSPNFMPPEQAGNGGETGRHSDVYGLGGLFFYLLTTRPPFVAPTMAELIHHVRASEPISPRLLNHSVPDAAAAICLRCLEKLPAKRYSSAGLLADDLNRFLRDEPVHATAASWTDFNLTSWSNPGYATRYLGHADALIPGRQYHFHICDSFLRRFIPKPEFQLCELGCGDGALAQYLVGSRPSIRATLVDGSAEMLKAACERLARYPGVEFVHATFDQIIRREVQFHRFDAIASSFAIHHLTPAERSALFFRVIDMLTPGGWFVNIDVGLADEPDLTEWHFELWREWLIETDKTRPAATSLRNAPEEGRQNPDNKYSSLESQLCALRVAGFANVEALYRNSVFTIYCGQRPGSA